MATLNEAIAKVQRLNAAVSNALEIEVAEEAKACIKEAALSEVYSYVPKFESRRMENGGLIDPDNMITTVVGNTLTVQNVTGLQNLWGGNDTSPLTPIVEDGVPNYYMPYPRPFMETAKEMLVNGRAEAAFRRGLARQGIDVSGMITEIV